MTEDFEGLHTSRDYFVWPFTPYRISQRHGRFKHAFWISNGILRAKSISEFFQVMESGNKKNAQIFEGNYSI